MTLSELDLEHLRDCVELAREALRAGDEPFGSVLVDPAGVTLRRERNRVGGGDHTQHPELLLVTWALGSLSVQERAAATVYTSGEHCPMCAAAHGWAGLGRIVHAVSAATLGGWRAGWGVPPSPVAALPIATVLPHHEVSGPAPQLEAEMRELHRLAAARA